MRSVHLARLAVAALVPSISMAASAGSIEIDLATAVERSHRLSPVALAARGEVAVAEGAVTAAELPFADNPEVELGAGPRLTPARPVDAEVRIEQNLELGRRTPRRQLARAGVAQAEADGAAALRELDLAVAFAFYDAVFAERSAELAARGEELAQRAAEAAARRRKAGEITDLEANLARGALGRARAARQAAGAERTTAVGRLAALIGAGADDVIVLRGELRSPPPDPAPRVTAASRPDVRALEARRAVAAAERDQAQTAALPQVAAWASYQREDRETIVLGGLRVTLPAWNRGQGETQAAAARERRAIANRDATLRIAEREIADAGEAYALASAAVAAFEREVVPVLDDAEQLLDRTIAAGQIAVADYLVARQEIIGGRREYLERLLALARAAAVARVAAGGAP